MKQALLLLIVLISEPCFAGEYSECLLENIRGLNATPFAISQIKIACKEKVLPYVPAKCENLLPAYPKPTTRDAPAPPHGTYKTFAELLDAPPTLDEYYRDIDRLKSDCADSCLNASYWSKHFGDCKE